MKLSQPQVIALVNRCLDAAGYEPDGFGFDDCERWVQRGYKQHAPWTGGRRVEVHPRDDHVEVRLPWAAYDELRTALHECDIASHVGWWASLKISCEELYTAA